MSAPSAHTLNFSPEQEPHIVYIGKRPQSLSVVHAATVFGPYTPEPIWSKMVLAFDNEPEARRAFARFGTGIEVESMCMDDARDCAIRARLDGVAVFKGPDPIYCTWVR